MIPGEIIIKDDDVVINDNRKTAEIMVKNTGDRPVQVGSHYHFYEVNTALDFQRDKAYGMHLDIPSGTAVRFEPGEEKTVSLVEVGGTKEIYGFNGLVEGSVQERKKP